MVRRKLHVAADQKQFPVVLAVHWPVSAAVEMAVASRIVKSKGGPRCTPIT